MASSKSDRTPYIKRTFSIDAIGALLSASLLGLLFPRVEYLLGMPTKALYVLAIFPGIFFLYDIGSYFLLPNKTRLLLKIIAIANFGYCLLSLAFILYYFPGITHLGLIYFSLEILIVLILARYEWKLATCG